MPSRAVHIAECIQRDFILGHVVPGEVVGSERELRTRFAVGRETLREAIAILEMRGVGRMRRGRHGGFVIAIPDLSLVARSFSGHALLIRASASHLSQARHILERIGGQVTNVIVAMLARSLATFQEHFRGEDRFPSLPRDPAQRITVGARRAGQIARNIVALLAQAPPEPGSRFGSERDLIHRFAISKSIARQVVRLLEDLNVARCQRGSGQGIFMTAPSAHRPAETMGLYLLTHAATPEMSWELAQGLRVESVRLAATHTAVVRESVCREAIALLQQLANGNRPHELENLFLIDRAVEASAANPLLTLILEGLKAYSLLARPQRDRVLVHFVADHGARYIRLTREVFEAIDAGNPHAAGEAQQRLHCFFTDHVRGTQAISS